MQNKSEKTFFTIMGILIFVSGIFTIFDSAISMMTKFQDNDAERIVVLAAMILGVIAGILEILAGISSFSSGKRKAKLGKGGKYATVSVILCLIWAILSLINGVMLWQLGTIFVTGMIIPILYLFSQRKRSVNKKVRERGRAYATKR